MFIRNYMLPKEKLTTVELGESLGRALEKINEGNFLSLPVIDGKEFKGILMKEAVYRNYLESGKCNKEEYLNNTKVEEIYNNNYESISADERIEKASYLLKELRTPFLPVFDSNDKFVGILTHFAIFNAFSEIFGIDKGTRIVINMFDLPGQLARLTDVIRKENINIINFAIMDPKVLDLIQVILRVDTDDVDKLVDKIQSAGFKIGEVTK
ncbi:CBS domain-containing protein [Tissierella praeacuta]|uniref:Acetoin utilization protein AcuB n=1 Tax=Tissierella praeacuta DSM 18095 TaxID=1123404 RepID=A0A1M4ZFC2_9FIRM|nr:CBS domain-containing protein [Tissierella praeacuta]TCU65360.1 acetoin utilization protein AcuB [Tissierella praeacuta]SHF16701.1 acetoin utilization protein AcuB [Tissierella praeacuta DSM 18095]SUP01943.1 putative manganese-dependent inorganic pyrophosphatase [Tissierella praeacuta]